MNVTHYNKSFPYIIIDNFYEDWELSLIWDELKFINHSYKWQTPTDNPGDGAKNIKTGEQLRKNKFQWIDSFYSNRHYSNILNVNRKIFNQDVWDECFKKHPHWFFNGFDCRHDTTLLSYYDEDGDEYKPHRDSSYVTCLFWTFNQPKKFDNGNLFLYNEEEKIMISCENNRMLIIPSRILHEVSPIQIHEDFGDNDGRYCISQFLVYSTTN
jgi:hypothetical protein